MDEAKIKKEVPQKVQNACIQAAREGFQEASMSGLCTEGAAEAAISAIQRLDLDDLLDDTTSK